MLFGDYVDQHPRWATFKKIDTEYGDAIKAAGGTVDWINLPDIGIKGNSPHDDAWTRTTCRSPRSSRNGWFPKDWRTDGRHAGYRRRSVLQRSAGLFAAAGKVTLQPKSRAVPH